MKIFLFPILSARAPIKTVVTAADTADIATIREISEALALNML